MSSSSLLLKRFGELRQDDDEESSKRIKTAMCAVIVATVINKVTLHYTVPNRLPPTVRDRSPLVTDCKPFVTVLPSFCSSLRSCVLPHMTVPSM